MNVWAKEARAAREREREKWRSRAWRRCEIYIRLLSAGAAREAMEPEPEEWEEWERQERERKKQDEDWHLAWDEDWHGLEHERPARSLKRPRPGFDDFE